MAHRNKHRCQPGMSNGRVRKRREAGNRCVPEVKLTGSRDEGADYATVRRKHQLYFAQQRFRPSATAQSASLSSAQTTDTRPFEFALAAHEHVVAHHREAERVCKAGHREI